MVDINSHEYTLRALSVLYDTCETSSKAIIELIKSDRKLSRSNLRHSFLIFGLATAGCYAYNKLYKEIEELKRLQG